MKRLISFCSILIIVSLSFGSQQVSTAVVVNESSTSFIESITLYPAFENPGGMIYTLENPAFEIKTSLPEEDYSSTMVNVYLNGNILLNKSVPLGNFKWENFMDSMATFYITDDDHWCYFINKDDTNEIYFEFYDDASNMIAASTVVLFQLDNSKPRAKAYDDDGDWILATGLAESHETDLYVEFYDPESHIRLENCTITFQDKSGQHQAVHSGETLEIIKVMPFGYKIKISPNFAMFREDLQNIPDIGKISNHLDMIITVENQLAQATTKTYQISFDLLDPVIMIEEHSWNIGEDDGFLIDERLPVLFQLYIEDPKHYIPWGSHELFSPASGLDYQSFKLFLDGKLTGLKIDNNHPYIELTPLADGDHQFAVRIRDHSGRESSLNFTLKVLNTVNIQEENIPATFSLEQSYPNPFNPTTTIRYSLAENSHVILTIYNSIGKKIDELINSDKPAGYHTITWDASDFPSGVYFYQLSTKEFSALRKSILLK